MEEQCELGARRGGRTRHLLDSASGANHNLIENLQELGAQYDQELGDLQYECDALQAPLATYDNLSEASCESLRFTCERLEVYSSASVSLHFCLKFDLWAGLCEFFMVVPGFFNYLMKLEVFLVPISSNWYRQIRVRRFGGITSCQDRGAPFC